MEFALTDRWSAKAEYMHYDLGTETFRSTFGPVLGDACDTQGDTVRVGVNCHFNPVQSRDAAQVGCDARGTSYRQAPDTASGALGLSD